MSQTEHPLDSSTHASSDESAAAPDAARRRAAMAPTLIVPVRSAEEHGGENETPHGLPAYWPTETVPNLRRFRVLGFAVALAAVGAAGVVVGRAWGPGAPTPDAALSFVGEPAATTFAAPAVAARYDTVDLSHIGMAADRSAATGDVRPSIAVASAAPASPAAASSTPHATRATRASSARRRRARAASVEAVRGDSGEPPPIRTPEGVTVRLVAETMIAAYASAVEARDPDRLARAYPALTSAERASWERFFRDAPSVEAHLDVRDFRLTPGGDSAEARVRGAYDYATKSGDRGREKVDFRALFTRAPSGAWRLARIRQEGAEPPSR